MATSRAYDYLFKQHGGSIPVAYLRALGKRESNLNPRESNDPAWGLMQVVPVVRTSYNSRYGTGYSKMDLLRPDVSVKMAVDTLERIVDNYKRFHGMRPNWSDPNYVDLVTSGWNSGYSEKAGVGKVMHYLRRNNIPVSHDNVFAYARAAGATKHLQTEQRRSWQKSVTDLYFQQPDRPTFSLVAALLVAAAAFAWIRYRS